jgi:hypothetical protein
VDADRRRKTVIAGTFAIGRKSLSNAQPISPVGSRRTSVIRMALTSIDATGAEDIYARALSRPSTLWEGKTRAPAPTRAGEIRRRGPVTIPGDPASGTRRGKIGRSPRRSHYDPDISHFLFPKTVATPRFFQP